MVSVGVKINEFSFERFIEKNWHALYWLLPNDWPFGV